jgi:hypothetical protein
MKIYGQDGITISNCLAQRRNQQEVDKHTHVFNILFFFYCLSDELHVLPYIIFEYRFKIGWGESKLLNPHHACLKMEEIEAF